MLYCGFVLLLYACLFALLSSSSSLFVRSFIVCVCLSDWLLVRFLCLLFFCCCCPFTALCLLACLLYCLLCWYTLFIWLVYFVVIFSFFVAAEPLGITVSAEAFTEKGNTSFGFLESVGSSVLEGGLHAFGICARIEVRGRRRGYRLRGSGNSSGNGSGNGKGSGHGDGNCSGSVMVAVTAAVTKVVVTVKVAVMVTVTVAVR